MELLQLKYFEKVATLENMTRAAKELHISQPALSNSIMRLEQELGVKFFDRTSRSIKLNKQGVYMLSKVKKILTMVDSITADSYSTVSGGTISIALDTHSSHLLDCIRARSTPRSPSASLPRSGSGRVLPFLNSISCCTRPNSNCLTPSRISPSEHRVITPSFRKSIRWPNVNPFRSWI